MFNIVRSSFHLAQSINLIQTSTRHDWPNQHSRNMLAIGKYDSISCHRYKRPISIFIFEAHYHFDFFCLFVTDLENDERAESSDSKHVECGMITEEIWNYYMSPARSGKVFRTSFQKLIEASSARTARTAHTGNKRRAKSSNMKEINEVIKVKRKPIQCCS